MSRRRRGSSARPSCRRMRRRSGRRLVGAARNLSLAGHDAAALAVANQADPLVDDATLRADLAHVRALAAVRSGRPHDVVALLVEAAGDVAQTDLSRAVVR